MEHRFTFIDLFAGIGGFHLAMHSLGGNCVFASEIDSFARKTYEENHKKISPDLFSDGLFNDDIRKIAPEEIPDFDVLCAGFPCQPFSQAGFKRGFEDNHNSERGNLFFNIAEIIESKKPRAFFLENVRGLATHDNGNTLKVILDILRNHLGYSVHYKIVKASDYGLPQHRPRTFIIGFRDDNEIGMGFSFPQPVPLKYSLSHVLGGKCDRKVGFTLRVGGRGSAITDRRNWDSYYVDGKVVRIGPEEGKRMQGFPEDFIFPVTSVQAMKQLGNSVAVDAIRLVGEAMISYMEGLSSKNNKISMGRLNKGEWAEPYAFIKIISDKRLYLSSEKLVKSENYIDVERVTNHNIGFDFVIFEGDTFIVRDKKTKKEIRFKTKDIFSQARIKKIKDTIIQQSGTFEIPEFSLLETELGVQFQKGGGSFQKADIILDFKYLGLKKKDEGLGIKGLLGAKPTLLNASSNTNFIYSVENFNHDLIDEVNNIDGSRKIKDRLQFIQDSGGKISFLKAEKDVMNYNLSMVDSQMPLIIGEILLAYFSKGKSSIDSAVQCLDGDSVLKSKLSYDGLEMLIHKVKKLLLDYTCGFFPGQKWTGEYTSNGTIVVDDSGDLHGFHIIDQEEFKNYLYNNTKFDTPSSSRHGFGKLYKERDGKLYFKLNLQLRYK
jgi:DNA (cytosine-5)-methyltransferase 1